MRLRKILPFVFALTLIATTTVQAAGLNVQMHVAHGWDPDQTTTVAEQLNSEWVRDEIRWRYVEWTKGNLSIPSTAAWVDEAVKKGLKPLCILGFGNAVYQENGDEYDNLHLPTLGTKTGDAAIKEKAYWDAWMDYVRFVATTYKGKIKAYEVWNEPNHQNFNNNVNAANYAKLYLATKDMIHSIDSEAIVLCGGVAGADHDFINAVLKYIKDNGGISQIDAFSLHFYVPGSTPEEQYLSNLNKTYLYTFLLKGYKGPIWMTENGAYTGTAQNAVSEREQAAYAIRFPVIFDSFLNSINTTGENFWYDIRNDGEDTTNSEHNYGLTYYNYNPKPAYKAAAIFNKLTNRMTFEKLTSNSDKYVAEYTDGKNNYTYVAWTTKASPQTVTIDVKGEVTTVYSMDGIVIDDFEETGNKSFTVTSEPILIHSAVGEPNFGDSTVISYNSETKKISVTGEIKYLKGEQEVSFLVVPEGTKLSNGLNPALIGYIGAVKVNSKNFAHSFALPEWYSGAADVYVAGLGIDEGVSGGAQLPDNKYMYVASIDVDKSSMVATAIVRNFTRTEKEAKIIVAGYNGDALVDVRIETIKVPAKTYQPTTFSTAGFTVQGSVNKVKAYVWSDMSELVPLIEPAEK